MKDFDKLMNRYEWVGSASNRIIIELKRTADMLYEVHNRFFKQYSISVSKFNLLYILHNCGSEGLMMSKIGSKMLVTKGNITGLIDRLEKQGYVERRFSPDDRRQVLAVITPEGREFTKKVLAAYTAWSNKLVDIIEDNEKNHITEVLRKLQDKLIRL